MKILSFIENEEVIKKILKHLGLWDIKTRCYDSSVKFTYRVSIKSFTKGF